MDNVHELQQHLHKTRNRLNQLSKFKVLLNDPTFQEFILKGYCEDKVIEYARVRALTTKPEELSLIDRRIDSIGQFQHYLSEIDREYQLLKDSINETTTLISTMS